jgi:predicted transcriptional regulator of viral defense system
MSQDISKGMQAAVRKIRASGGQIRMVDAIKAGINRRVFYALRDEGVIELVTRGRYRLAELPPLTSPDMVSIVMRVPHGVVCLISALSFHEITTQIPAAVDIAIPNGKNMPRIHMPPVHIHRFREPSYSAGVETHNIDGLDVRIYDPEKTIADCFKCRRQLGMEVVLEALNFYRTRMTLKADRLMRYAGICRVEDVIRPYLEATL